MDELTSRQRTVLGLVVRESVKSTSPVSSRALVDSYGLQVSTATVRNELARLEELGYLTLERVRRPPKKPKRRSRDEMARRAKSYLKDDAHKRCATTINLQWLEPSAAGDRMHDSNAGCANTTDFHPAPHASASTHREWTIRSWSWGLIAPLIRIAKAAKIMR